MTQTDQEYNVDINDTTDSGVKDKVINSKKLPTKKEDLDEVC